MQTGGAEPQLLLFFALGQSPVNRIPSRSVTLNLPQYRTAHPPYSPAHTDTMFTTTLCCHIAGILIRVQECLAVQRVASAPPKSLDATNVILFMRENGRAEEQLHSLLVSALDRFVPDKNLV